MNDKQVLSSLLAAIIVLTVAASIAAATDDGGCSIESNPEAQSAGDSLNSGIDDVLDNKLVFLFFYTDWCHFCQQQMHIIDELEEEYARSVAFIRINVNERPAHAEEFGVHALPTMFIVSDRNEEGYIKQGISGFTGKER